MTIAHLHLLITHIPVLGVSFGFLLLVYAAILKKEEVKKVAFIVLVLSAVITAPTFFSGEKSEDAIEDLPGVSERIMEEHENSAKVAAGLTYLLGVLSLLALLGKLSAQKKNTLMASVLFLSMITGGVMAKTANLGGQIRHSEIRTAGLGQDSGNSNNENNNEGGEKDGKDND